MRFFSKGHPALRDWGDLNPKDEHPPIVYKRWREFVNNPQARWYCYEPRIHCVADIKLWSNSKELGRLLHFIEARDSAGFGDSGFEVARFETQKSDLIWVCEADFLKQYHEGKLETFEAHQKFAESRLNVSEYHGQFKLPEYLVGNVVSQSRLTWRNITKKIKPIELTTRVNIPAVTQLSF